MQFNRIANNRPAMRRRAERNRKKENNCIARLLRRQNLLLAQLIEEVSE